MKVRNRRITNTIVVLGGMALLGGLPLYGQESDSSSIRQLEERISILEKQKEGGLKVSGYFQSQYQYGQENASLKVGAANADPTEDFSRIGIRRGRLKFSYEKNIATGIFQIDMTDKGMGLKDAYLQLKDPTYSASSFKAGLFNRPFGYEIERSSSRRESPERSTLFQTLFPEERDLGALLTLQAHQSSPWNMVKLNMGLFAGNGIKSDIKNKKDFIGHLSVQPDFSSKISLGGGVSYYRGGVYQGSENRYTASEKSFIHEVDSNRIGAYTKREYIGMDFQLGFQTVLGSTSLFAEYVLGTQPGEKENSKSPNQSSLPTSDTFVRSFRGGYVSLVQNLGDSPLALFAKYDTYDPNDKVSGDDIGPENTGKGDIRYQTIGLGALWNINSQLRWSANYDWVKNETSKNLLDYEKDRKDNVFTLRIQYLF